MSDSTGPTAGAPASQETPGQDVDVVVESDRWEAAGLDPEALAHAAVTAAAAEMGRVSPPPAVVFADDALLKRLNREFRGKAAPTNVLSFPADRGGDETSAAETSGDIILAYETIAREAAAWGLSLHARTLHMIAHGFLHLHGYDHETDDDATRMEAMERMTLARLGLGDPYEADNDIDSDTDSGARHDADSAARRGADGDA